MKSWLVIKQKNKKALTRKYINECIIIISENIENLNINYETKVKKVKEKNEKKFSEQEGVINDRIKWIVKIVGEIKHKENTYNTK